MQDRVAQLRRRLTMAAMLGLASPRLVLGQPKVVRVGYLSMSSPEGDRRMVDALRRGLHELGYVEGQNLIFEQRHALNDMSKVGALAAQLVARGASMIVLYGSPAVRVVEQTGVPVIMTVHPDPVGAGLAQSLARPGGAITGLTDGHMELGPKRLEVFKEVVPSISRVALLFNPGTRHALGQCRLVESAAPRLALTTIPLEVKSAAEIDGAFARLDKARADALFIIPDPSWSAGREQHTARLAAARRLPAIGTIRAFAERGMLASFGTNFEDLWHQAAGYVDKISKGARAAELPIEFPRKFELTINLKTAQAIGVAIPRAVLLRADHVIQ